MDALIVAELIGDDYEVVQAESLSAALEQLADWQPACALVDLSLPDARGTAIVAAVRAAAPTMPVIALSGFDDPLAAAEARAAGACDYVVKEIDPLTLLTAITAALA